MMPDFGFLGPLLVPYRKNQDSKREKEIEKFGEMIEIEIDSQTR